MVVDRGFDVDLYLNLVATFDVRASWYRLKAKDASKAAKDRMTEDMAKRVGGLNRAVGRALRGADQSANRLRKYGKVARRKLAQLHQTMKHGSSRVATKFRSRSTSKPTSKPTSTRTTTTTSAGC